MSPLANALRVHHLLRARGVSEHTHEHWKPPPCARCYALRPRCCAHARTRSHARTQKLFATEAGLSLVAICTCVNSQMSVTTPCTAYGLFVWLERTDEQR